MSPQALYKDKLATGEFQEDVAQAQVIALLDDLYHRFVAPEPATSLLGRIKRRFWVPTPTVLQGLYIWGGVGRGKTMMMDLFYDCLPAERRLRMHFHRFMKRVHNGLTKWEGTANPLSRVADEFAGETDIICFDEFFVSDIGDAMILAELFTALFGRGVCLVATSNVEPARLYENGLQRRRFLPTIDLLYKFTQVHHIPDGMDFRLRTLEQAEIYHSPLDAQAEESLLVSLLALAPHEPEKNVVLKVEGREIRARYEADDVVWFDFSELCEGPRSQNDYIELAMVYHAVLVSNIPVFDVTKEDAARRFISLVDEFYDHGVKLIVSAAAAIPNLYQGDRLASEFERTRSRLLEMQSREYLGASHQAGFDGA
mgnify:FL=1